MAIGFTYYNGWYNSCSASNPLIVRVPFVLMVSFKTETSKKQGTRVLRGYLVLVMEPFRSYEALPH